MKRFLSFVFALVIFSCTPKEENIKSYFGISISKARLDKHLQQRMQELNIPGMSIAFINDGEIVHMTSFGYASVEERIPVDLNTIFEAASLSKPVFSFFVMNYVDAGKLDIDSPLYQILPNPAIEQDERYKKITARMALSHQTGFPNWRDDYPDKSLFLLFEPGKGFHYSGEGYQYLAEVLKDIDKTDWEDLDANFQLQVCQPLGLKNSAFLLNDKLKTIKARPYNENGDWISPEINADSLYRKQFRSPASLHTDIQDLSRWLQALMEREGLSKNSYKELFNPQSDAGKSGPFNVHYTLGFFHPQIPFTNLYMHGGNNLGFTAYFVLDPNKKWGYALLTNSEFGEELGNELLQFMAFGR